MAKNLLAIAERYAAQRETDRRALSLAYTIGVDAAYKRVTKPLGAESQVQPVINYREREFSHVSRFRKSVTGGSEPRLSAKNAGAECHQLELELA